MTRLEAILTPLVPHSALALPLRFAIGAVVILTIWFAVGLAVCLLPTLIGDLITLGRGCFASDETPKVVDIEEHRRKAS